MLQSSESTSQHEEVKSGDASHDQQVFQLLYNGENSSLDQLFSRCRQTFSKASSHVTKVKDLAIVEFIRHEFEGYDYRLQAHSLRHALDLALK